MPPRASPIKSLAHRFIAVIVGPLFILGLLLSISTLAKYHDNKTLPTPLLVVELSTWAEPQKTQPARPTPPQGQAEKKPAKPKPVPKKAAPKPIPKKPSPKAQPQSKPTTDTPQMPVQDTAAVVESPATSQALPTPVPMFKLSQVPQFLHQEPPIYPEAMRSQGRQAEVKLAVLIDKSGQVRQITILQSAGQLFDAAATQAINASTFIPAKAQGKAVAVILRLPIKFRLR